MEAAGTCAAGIDVEDAVFFVLSRLVGMAEEDDVNSGGGRLEVEIADVVDEVERGGGGFDDFCLPQFCRPGRGVYIPANRHDRREFSQFIENFGFADVACMKNQLRIT